MARTLEVFLPVSIGKKRGKQGETFYLLWGSFLWCCSGGFYSFALRTSAVATIKSRCSIKRQATNFRRLARTSTSRGGERRAWKKALYRIGEKGIFGPGAENAQKFFLIRETSHCRARRIIALSARWLEYLTAGFLHERGICLAFDISVRVNGNAKLERGIINSEARMTAITVWKVQSEIGINHTHTW